MTGRIHERVHWIDIARGLGIALVTFVHIPNGDGESVWLPAIADGVATISMFHMPLFFLLSGFTFKNKDGFRKFAFHKAKTLLIPYYVFSLYALAKPIAVLLVPSLYNAVGSTHSYSIWGQIFDVLIAGNGLWFLMALFVGEMVVFAIESMLSKNKSGELSKNRARFTAGCVLVVLTALRSEFVPLPFDPFQLFAGIRAAGFMLVGLSFRHKVFSGADIHALSPLLVSAGFLVIAVVGARLALFTQIAANLMAAFAGASFVIYISVIISRCAPLEYVGRNSLTYYAVNALTMNVIKLVIFRVLRINASMLSVAGQYLVALVIILVAFLVLALESEFIKRYLWWAIGRDRPKAKARN